MLPLIPAVLCAIAFGLTMKIADLQNEHGLKLFEGASLLFGVLWGAFGAVLLLCGNDVANIILAMNVAFIIRNRLDYLNHQVAATMIIIAFLLTSQFNAAVFLSFFCVFLAFGLAKDHVKYVMKKKNGMLLALNDAMLYYPIPTLAYSTITGEWAAFAVFFCYTVGYDVTKYAAKKSGIE